VAVDDSVEPDQKSAESTAYRPDKGGEPEEAGAVSADLREVSFPHSVRGYDRHAVDAYVARVDSVIAELEAKRSPEAAVKRALEEVGERTTGILQRVGEAAEEIAAAARRKADESTARAGKDAEETVAAAKSAAEEIVRNAKAEAKALLAEARKEAAEQVQTAKDEVKSLREEAEARLHELRLDTDAVRGERRMLLEDIREIAAKVGSAAEGADTRFPPSDSPNAELVEAEAPAETEQSEVNGSRRGR
jgi:DivIVA domain-containing protein